MALIQIQSSISGYRGEPVTLYSAYDTEMGILVVAKCVELTHKRKKDAVVITNLLDIARDAIFDESMLKDAIETYQKLNNELSRDKQSKRIVFTADTKSRCNPSPSIEIDKIESSGTKYLVNPEVSNAHIAVLATCLYTLQIGAVSMQMKMADDLIELASDLYSVENMIMTI